MRIPINELKISLSKAYNNVNKLWKGMYVTSLSNNPYSKIAALAALVTSAFLAVIYCYNKSKNSSKNVKDIKPLSPQNSLNSDSIDRTQKTNRTLQIEKAALTAVEKPKPNTKKKPIEFKPESLIQDLTKQYRESDEKFTIREGTIGIALTTCATTNISFQLADTMQADFVNRYEVQAHLYELSQKLFSPFKENLIFSLGQSPAWFSVMAELDEIVNEPEKTRENPHRFSSIAFSGDWYGLFDHRAGKEELIDYKGRNIEREEGTSIVLHTISKDRKLELIEKNKPTPNQTTHYRSYLSSIGCSPERILEQKVPVVLNDYVHRAGGFKSFLEFLFTWAEEEGFKRDELKKLVVVQCMYDVTAELFTNENEAKAYFQANLGEYSSAPVILTAVTKKKNPNPYQTDGIRNLFNKETLLVKQSDGSDMDINQARRLVKQFPPAQWTEENCKKDSFVEINGQRNPYILPIVGNFVKALKKIKTKKNS